MGMPRVFDALCADEVTSCEIVDASGWPALYVRLHGGIHALYPGMNFLADLRRWVSIRGGIKELAGLHVGLKEEQTRVGKYLRLTIFDPKETNNA